MCCISRTAPIAVCLSGAAGCSSRLLSLGTVAMYNGGNGTFLILVKCWWWLWLCLWLCRGGGRGGGCVGGGGSGRGGSGSGVVGVVGGVGVVAVACPVLYGNVK